MEGDDVTMVGKVAPLSKQIHLATLVIYEWVLAANVFDDLFIRMSLHPCGAAYCLG
jgi:hypothetical protein